MKIKFFIIVLPNGEELLYRCDGWTGMTHIIPYIAGECVFDGENVLFDVPEVKTQNTIKFTVPCDDKDNMRRVLRTVFDALQEKGYNPINQIVGYLLTEDPTYITNYNNARSMICKLDRDELLQELVRQYLA